MKPIVFDSAIFSYLLTMISVPLPGAAIMGVLVAVIFRWKNISTIGKQIFATPEQKHKEEIFPIWQTFWGWTLFVALAATFYTGMKVTHFSFFELLNKDGFQGAVRLIKGILNPNLKILPQALTAIVETVYLAFIATVLAVPAAFFFSFLCAKNIMGGSIGGLIVYNVLRGFFNIIRSLEPLIWAIIFSVWVGIGPFAGMLALLLHTLASLAKQYSEQIECVENGPIEGIQSTGANSIQVLWYGIVPQVVLPFVAFTIYRWDINVRMATVIGLVGGGGIGTLLIQYQGVAMWEEVGCIALVIVVVVWIMDSASAYIREGIK